MERWFVGLVMAAIAFALEKAVARALRKGAEPTAAPEEGTFARSRGPDVDAG